jgi:hypothetical protein
MRDYFKKLLPFSFVVAVIIFLLSEKYNHWGPPSTWFAVFGFFLLSSIFFYVVAGHSAKDSKTFIRKFMLGTTLRMFSYLALITLVFLFMKENAKGFTLIFLCHYLFFFPFDTVVLFLQARKPLP